MYLAKTGRNWRMSPNKNTEMPPKATSVTCFTSLSLMSKSKRATRGSRRHSDPGTLHTATALALHEDIDYLDES